jgi:hypothetical protein
LGHFWRIRDIPCEIFRFQVVIFAILPMKMYVGNRRLGLKRAVIKNKITKRTGSRSKLNLWNVLTYK